MAATSLQGVFRHGRLPLGKARSWVSYFTLALLAQGCGPAPSRSPAPEGLRVEGLDAGEVWSTREHQFKLRIVNPSPVPVSIRGFSTSCSCTSVSPSSLIVPANGSAESTVLVNLNKAAGGIGNQESWPLKVDVRPLIEGGPDDQAASWVLRATIKKGLMADPSHIQTNAESPFIVGSKPKPWDITLASQDAMQAVQAASDPPGLDIQVRQVDSRHYSLHVQAPTLQRAGQVKWSIWVEAESGNGIQHKSLVTTIEGHAVTPVAVRPAAISLGAVPIGVPIRVPAQVYSVDGRRFRVASSDIRAEAAGATVDTTFDSKELTAEPRDFWIRLVPHKEGRSSSTVRIVVEDEATHSAVTIEASIMLHGIPAPK